MKLFASAFTGALLAFATVYFFLLPDYRDNYISIGEANGLISAKTEIASRLKREFPIEAKSCITQSVLFDVKSTSVYIAICRGTRTVLVEE